MKSTFKIAKFLKENNKISEQDLIDAKESKDKNVLKNLIEKPYTRKLTSNLIQNKNLPFEYLKTLVERDGYFVIGELDIKRLTALAKDKNEKIRSVIAEYCNDPKILKVLSNSDNRSVIYRLIRNDKTPSEVLHSFAKTKKDPYIIETLSARRNNPIEVIEEIITHSKDPKIFKNLIQRSLKKSNADKFVKSLLKKDINFWGHKYLYQVIKYSSIELQKKLIRKILTLENLNKLDNKIWRKFRKLDVKLIEDVFKMDTFEERMKYLK